MATARAAATKPPTTTGVDASVMVPLPNWPLALAPQHLAVPFANTAHVWSPPAVITTAVTSPLTTTCVDESVRVPLPNWPWPLAPQHRVIPYACSTHEC